VAAEPSDSAQPIDLDRAVDLSRTGDVWLFRGSTLADRAIRLTTNAPVNHVGMTVAVDDLPPLLWHAELGQSLPDRWTGTRHRGAQLHDLHDAVQVWVNRYGQRAWFRQLDRTVSREEEDALLRTVARLSGTPFPNTTRLAARWVTGRARIAGPGRRKRDAAALETAYCAEVVALSYVAMGLLSDHRRLNWYDPGRFWSGDDLDLLQGARLGREIAVRVPEGLPDGVPPLKRD